MILAEPRHEPKVRQGVTTEVIGVDGNAYAPFHDARTDLDKFVELNGGLDGRPDDRRTTGTPSPSTSPGSTSKVSRQHRATSSATRRSGSRPLGWDDVAGRRPSDRRRCAVDAARGDGGGRLRARAPGSTTRPAPTPRPPSWPTLANEAGAAWRHLPHPRPLRARRPLPRSVPGGDRDRSAGRVAGAHHPLLPSGDVPGHARSRCSRSSTTPGRGPRRHLRRLPVRVGEHAAADPHAAVGPGGRPGAARRSASPTARSATRIREELRGARHAVRRAGRPAGHPARLLRAAGAPALGGLDDRRGPGRDRAPSPSTSLCDLLLSEDLRVNEVTPGPHLDGIRRFYRHPVGDGRHRQRVRRRPSRARGRTAASRASSASSCATSGCSALEEAVAQDDRRAGGAPRAARPRPARRRARGRRRRVRPGDGPRASPRTTSRASSPSGIEHVIVNGELVVDGGVHTGALPGPGAPPRPRLTGWRRRDAGRRADDRLPAVRRGRARHRRPAPRLRPERARVLGRVRRSSGPTRCSASRARPRTTSSSTRTWPSIPATARTGATASRSSSISRACARSSSAAARLPAPRTCSARSSPSRTDYPILERAHGPGDLTVAPRRRRDRPGRPRRPGPGVGRVRLGRLARPPAADPGRRSTARVAASASGALTAR